MRSLDPSASGQWFHDDSATPSTAIRPGRRSVVRLVTCVPITRGGNHARLNGLTVAIAGHDTTGVAVCNQMRTFDLRARAGDIQYVETLDQ